MRLFHTLMGAAAAFLLGVALAIAVHPRPLFRDLAAYLHGGSAMDRCRVAGACNAVQGAPARPRRQMAPADLDRA